MFQNPSDSHVLLLLAKSVIPFPLTESEEEILLFLINFWFFSYLNSRSATLIRVSFHNLLNMDSPAKFNITPNNKYHKSVSVFHGSYSNERKLKLIGNREESNQGTCSVLDALP